MSVLASRTSSMAAARSASGHATTSIASSSSATAPDTGVRPVARKQCMNSVRMAGAV